MIWGRGALRWAMTKCIHVRATAPLDFRLAQIYDENSHSALKIHIKILHQPLRHMKILSLFLNPIVCLDPQFHTPKTKILALLQPLDITNTLLNFG